MVHAYDARSDDRACRQPQRPAVRSIPASGAETSAPMRYVLIPDPLITAYAHDPLSVGVYAAVARLAMATKDRVPLAAADLAAWMGSTEESDRAAMMRRITKLHHAGWLDITRERAAKHRLLPTWGRDRAGCDQPWRFGQANTGRPEHLRGRRVPLALFDDYLGRLEPQPSRRPALISRYFTRPLLDLADIGAYIVGLRVEQRSTPRLRHLRLVGEQGILEPQDGHALLALAAANALTTLDTDQTIVPVQLSTHGRTRLGLAAPVADEMLPIEQPCGSVGRSGSRSPTVEEVALVSCLPEAIKAKSDTTHAGNAWEVGMLEESTNHDSTTHHALQTAGGLVAPDHMFRSADTTKKSQHPQRQTVCASDLLDPLIVAGHRDLNPQRVIPPGEWWELLVLQQAHGAPQLLIWQARARRAPTERPDGVTPAYYVACAGRAALAAYRPRRESLARTLVEPPATASSAAVHTQKRQPPTKQAPMDPTCAALLRAMGVRQIATCAGVSEDLIRQWQAVIDHPGLVAHFDDPIAFAVTALRQQHPPPSTVELDRWARRARERHDRYETWRHLPPVDITPDQEAAALQRVVQARAIAPPDADDLEVTLLVLCLEEGLDEAEALARLFTQRSAAMLPTGQR